jgi:multiple sugar transport system substrate-binding protein
MDRSHGAVTRRTVGRWVGGLLAAGAAGGALAACNPSGQAGSPGAGSTLSQSGEITWQIADNGQVDGQAWFDKTFIPAFTKDRPDVKINMLYVTWQEHGAKRDTLFAAGQGADLLQSGAGLAHAYRKLVVPLDDRLRRWKEWGDYFPSTLATSTWQDKHYGVPARVDARGMVYRKDLFDQQGLKLPETWDEMRQAAIALTRKEGGDVAVVGFDPNDWDDKQFGSQRYIPVAWQNGAEIVSPDNRKATFNSTEGIDALKYWNDLFTQIAPLEAKLPAAPPRASRLAGGTAAAMLVGQWIQADAVQVLPEALPNLVVRPPLKQRKQQINLFTNWFGLGSQSKFPDLSWDVLMAFNRSENLLEYARLVTSTLPRKGLPDSQYSSDPRYQIKTWTEIVEKYSRPNPLIVTQSGTDAGGVMSLAMRNVREGKQSPKQALDEAAKLWQEYLDGGAREFGL